MGNWGKIVTRKIFGDAGIMTDKQFVISVEPSAFASPSNLSGFVVIYDHALQFHKLSEYHLTEDCAWKDAADRLRKKFLDTLES
jgi:hypothetical protein